MYTKRHFAILRGHVNKAKARKIKSGI
jgi:hypothetical protein